MIFIEALTWYWETGLHSYSAVKQHWVQLGTWVDGHSDVQPVFNLAARRLDLYKELGCRSERRQYDGRLLQSKDDDR